MRKLALAFGPTGGHLIPACLVARAWEEKTGGEAMLFSTADTDHALLDGYDVPYNKIDFHPWVGSLSNRFANLAVATRSYIELRSDLESVSAVLGLGGYPSVPIMGIARERGIPTFIQEQNRVPGRANRLFMSDVFHTFFGLPPMNTKIPGRATVTGNPVRRQPPVTQSWFTDNPLLLVFGGSQGSSDLSELLREGGGELMDSGWHIYHIRGQYGQSLQEHFSDYADQFREEKQEPELPSILATSDCVWGRAGAGTISELIHYGVPAILFPYPYAADSHQEENARWLKERGPVAVFDSTHPRPPAVLRKTLEITESSRSYQVPWDRERPAEIQIVEEILEWT